MKRWRVALGALLMLVALSAPALLRAHELLPGYLELNECDGGRYQVLWKLPLLQGNRLPIAPRFPDTCSQQDDLRSERSETAWIYRASLSCSKSLSGQSIAVDGLDAFDTDVLLRFQPRTGSVETHVLKPTEPSVTVGAPGQAPTGPWAYLGLGIEHILLGLDHLLFILGLLLIVKERWMLLKTITAFTVAHSLTLAVATFGIATIPTAPLNAAIALSIFFLGPEIVRTWRGQSSFTIRHPWVVAFGFGLLHGFGFASGLAQLGLPRRETLLALLLFNVGVELGQLSFVLVVELLQRSFRQLEIRWPLWMRRLPGYAVGSLGAFWTLQRSLMLLQGGAQG